MAFKNDTAFNDVTHFYQTSDRRSSNPYMVTLPKDTFRNLSANNNFRFDHNNDSRVAVGKDITDAINSLKAEINGSEQILSLSYSPYSGNGVKQNYYLSNKNYQYDDDLAEMDDGHKFFRYAGIKSKQEYVHNGGSLAKAEADGAVFKTISGKYNGVPLTKSYK